MITAALDMGLALEERKKAALGLAAEVGTSKFADMLVRVEPYAEWITLGIALATYGALYLEGMLREMFAKPEASTPQAEKPQGPEGEPMKEAEVEKVA